MYKNKNTLKVNLRLYIFCKNYLQKSQFCQAVKCFVVQFPDLIIIQQPLQ